MYNYEQDNEQDIDDDLDAENALIDSANDLTDRQPAFIPQKLARHVVSLMHLINRLKKSSGKLFKMGDINSQGYGPEWIGRITCGYPSNHKNFRLYFSIIEHLAYWNQYVKDGFPLHEMNPYFTYFYREASRLNLNFPSNEFDIILYGCGPESIAMCSNLNALVTAIRNIDADVTIASEMKRFQRGANDNYRSATEYVNAMFHKHSRLLVVRIDLAYRKNYLPVGYQYKGGALNPFQVSVDEFLQHRQILLESLQRHTVFEYLKGYVIKLEHGRDKGFHMHCLFLFDGSKVREGISRGSMIGEFWVNHITHGNGLFYNCNLSQNYFYNGVGMVHSADAEKRIGVDYAVKYMTKADAIMRLSLGNARIISRGVMPNTPDVKRGRPRCGDSCDIDFLEEEII